jgi:Phospholipase_D-nuclease N-terminal
MNPALPPLLVLILLLGFDAFCLVDLARADEVRYLPKLWWGLAICCFTPFGGIAYLSAGRLR